MGNESVMPISTQKIALEQFSEIQNKSNEPGKQLNKLFFNMMMKPMFESAVAGVKSSTTTQLHQQLFLNALTQDLSDKFDLGFSKLQHNIEQQKIVQQERK